MTRTVFQLRLSEDELLRWKAAADGPLSKWIRRVMNEEVEARSAVVRDREAQRQERLEMVQSLSPLVEPAVNLRKCAHGVRLDRVCKLCPSLAVRI